MTAPSRSAFTYVLIVLIWVHCGAALTSAQKPELVVQAGHSAIIKTLALSLDGKLLASSGADKRIIIWDLVTEKQIRSLTGHDGWVFSLAFSPDGKFLASGSYDGAVKIWNLSNAKIEFEISSLQPYNITSLTFSPDSQTLAIASADKIINLWDMRAGKMKQPLRGHAGSVTQVAFHSDGKTLVSSSLDKTMRFWDLSTKKTWQTGALPQGITGFAFSPNGQTIALCTEGGTIGVLDVNIPSRHFDVLFVIPPQKVPGIVDYKLDYRHLRRLGNSPYLAGSVAFVSDKEVAFVDGFKLRSWDVEKKTEKLSRDIESEHGAYAVIVNRETNLLIYSDGVDLKLLDPATQKQHSLQGGFSIFRAVVFNSDGKTLAGALDSDKGFQTWGRKIDEQSKEIYSMMANMLGAYTIYVSSQHVWAMFYRGREDESRAANINLVDLASDKESFLTGHTGAVTSITVNPAETILASSSNDGTIKLWDLKARRVQQTLKESAERVLFSPDGKFLAVWGTDGKIKLLEVNAWEKAPISIDISKTDPIMLFSPNGQILATASGDAFTATELKLWKVPTGELLHTLDLRTSLKADSQKSVKSTNEPLTSVNMWQLGNPGTPYKTASGPIAFSPDSSMIACEEVNHPPGINRLKIWDVNTGKEVSTLTGHVDSIRSVAFSPKGKILASAGWDRTLRVWNPRKGVELATLIPIDKDNWVVFTPDGRFDTNLDLDQLNRLSWTWPSDPFNPLSVRVFMRDYYEPKLLEKILAGEELKPVRDLSHLNRAQPLVGIKEIKPDSPETVQVTVEVSNAVSRVQADARGLPMRSGVFDVRLLRNRQLVASSTADEVLSGYVTKTALSGKTQGADEQELKLWRQAHEVKLDVDGRARLTFHNIKLPRRNGLKEVSFSAYAFNSDRVTSEATPAYVYKLPPAVAKIKRRAYVITVGVDANQSGWNLDFAAKSAEDMRAMLRERLAKEYEVVDVALLSTLDPSSPRLALDQAKKKNIDAVLNMLAGRPVNDEVRKQINPDGRIRAATPDDLVLLYISSHGYADPQGNFYVIPSDTGKARGISEPLLNTCLSNPEDRSQRCADARAFLANSISTGDLAQGWRKIDAGEMVMILDACHAAAVPGRDFRPGPLGDRGFGQLSYDKGMLILTATQPDKTASATLRVGTGGSLLSDALVSISKTNPRQKLAEWLKGTEKLVPRQYKRLYPDVKEEDIQFPVLLDFTKRQATIRLN